MNDTVKIHNTTGVNMWERFKWSKMGDIEIYASTYCYVI